MQHPAKKQKRPPNQKWRILCPLIALALALVFVLLVLLIRKAFPPGAPDYQVVHSTVRTLDTRAAAELESITIFPDGQNSYRLLMRDGVLMLERGGSLLAIEENYQQEILNTVTEVSVQDTVTESAVTAEEDLAAMGLDQPQCSAVIRYTDGREETMEVGARVYGGVEYYFRWSGAEGVYICHSGVLESLSVEPNLLIPFEQTSIYSNLVEKITVENANGKCTVTFEENATAFLTEPRSYPLTDDMARTLKTALGSFRLGAYEAELTAENADFYGFDAPLCTLKIEQREGTVNAIDEYGGLTIAQAPAQTLCFVIGRAEGEFFYTCAYQNEVYLISRFLAETLLQTNWKTLISRTPAAMGDRLLSDVVFETPENTVEVRITRTENVLENNELETDAEGNLVYQTTVTVNGRETPVEQMEALLDRLNAFTVEGDIPVGAALEEKPRWRITLVAENGEVRVLEGFRLDVFSDAVSVNGTMCHYVYNGAIDVLMSGLV